ncbi:MAG: ATP-dependent sacrificial sulfur transferase LarE [Planctomycetes bacterium]|nr:ATP-dependent sacrificial sulfur transferase LarE [Planctomycetota bacterium]
MDAADSTTKPPTSLDAKHARMREILRELQSVAVAFSAGVDSTLVLKVALDTLGSENVLAVTGRSDSVAAAELAEAGRIVFDLAVEHVVLDTDEFDNPNYVSNPHNRCYFCKTSLYRQMTRLLNERGIKTIVNGTNVDDLGDYRPGLDAAREHGVRSPLAEAGLTKADVRSLSRRLGLATHDKPAAPCLSSRVPYGEAVTPEKLRMIEAAERFLHDEIGVRECRVRHHSDLARIEVAPENLTLLTKAGNAARIDAHFRSLGYTIVTVDLRGFRSGSLNEALPLALLHTMG